MMKKLLPNPRLINSIINRFPKKHFLFFLTGFLFVLQSYGQTFTDTTPAGTETWTVPAGVTSVTVQCWAGGGAGGGDSQNGGIDGAGGGAGGTYVSSVIAVTPGQIINYDVGAGGVGDTNNGNVGDATWFNNTGTLYAQGGNGGVSATNGRGGGVGSIFASIGAIRTPGANGANGSATIGGAGGAGAFAGGAGGAQRNTEGDGNPGTNPGGGGGGSFTPDNTNHPGGNGGNGQVVITWTVAPTGPANDEPCNAINLTVGASCTYTNYTNASATGTTGVPAPGCGSYSGGDVWFTVTVPASGNIIIDSDTGVITDSGMAIYSVTTSCPSLTLGLVECDDDDSSNGAMSAITLTGRTPGEVLYIRFWEYGNNNNGTFGICATEPPPPPANDDPCGAVSLTVNSDLLCTSTTSGTVESSTNSGINPAACSGTPDDDVWYSFVATSTAHTIDLLNITGSTTDMYHAVYGGFIAPDCSVAVGDNISCEDSNSSTLGGLVINETYFVQVYTWTSTTGQTSTFDICIGTPPPPPANDEPCGAIGLTVNPSLTCTSTTSGTVESATNSGINVCVGTEDDDVWYSFVATSTAHTVDLLNITGSVTNMTHAVYGGFISPDCTVAVGDNIMCSDPNSSLFGGLVVGETYFVQVYTWTGTTGQNTTFDICVGTPPPPPANDEPCGAVSLTVNPDYSCANTTSGTVTSATNSGIEACFGSEDDDVWYSFVATSTAHSVDLLNVSGSVTDMFQAVYGGFVAPDCSVAVGDNINCSDPNSSVFGGLTPGQTYFVQVFTYTSTTGQNTTFDICIGTPPPPPANDEACGAISLTVNATCIGTSGTIASATNSGIDSCFGTPDDDVWYSFVATYTSQTVTLTNIFGSTTDMFHAVYGPFTPPDCSVAVVDNISCNDGNSTDLIGLTVGATYYVQVFTYTSTAGQTSSFDICVTEPCTNTDPTNNTPTVCPLIVGEQGVDPFTAVPFDPDPSFGLDCTNPTLTLQAHSTIRATDSYMVEQIAYPSPAPDYNFATFGGVGVQTIADDDVWANAWTDLDFNFCFYGNTYTQTLVGANGMITFDSTRTPGSSCGYSFNANLPSLVGDLFNETIYGVYHDLDPRGLTGTPIKSKTVGTPGCRQFILAFNNIPLFSDATVSREFTGMIVLHETTNIIEVFIENKRIENGNVGPWNNGNAIVGLQGDANAGEAITAPCRNGLDSNWETTNEAWRFVPNGAIIAPDSVDWFSASSGATVIGTGSTLTVTTPDTYTAEVTYTTCGNTFTFSDDVVVTQSSKTWNGSMNTDWYDDNNWTPSGIPTAADCVLIPDITLSNNRSPIADIIDVAPLPPTTPAQALNLTVANNGYIEIMPNTNLKVTNWIHLDGNIDIRNTGSLIQVNDGAPNVNNNTGNGTINMQRTATIATPYDYIYWSSPVEGFGVSNVSPGSSYIFEWIPTIGGNGAGNYGNWLATSENMINGKGYIIRNIAGTPTPSTPEFIGRPNNGIITKAITRGNYNGANYTGGGSTIATGLDDNWNLVGNPYPSAISASTFSAVNPSISGTVYLWRHLAVPSNVENSPFYANFVYNYNPNDYIAYNSSGSNPPGFGGDIAAGQAFFVLMEHTAPIASNVVFNNTMRNETLDNSQFYRTEESSQQPLESEKHRIWLDLISPESTASSILVGYIEGATNAQDRLFDGYELSETSTRFYSIIDTDNFAIQGKALPFEDTDVVPLGIKIGQTGSYSIALNTIDGLFENTNQAIYVEDTYTNIIHDLRVNPYSFNIDAGTYDDRFLLRYTNPSLSVDEINPNSGLEIMAPNNSFIKVKSGISPIHTVVVYDLLGRVLIEQKDIDASEFSINNFNYSEGTYFVKATLLDGKQKIKKVILKN